ncbi:hypothetical protein [Aestuariispira ectoiniformans]|uniref:hypothetical protein n=1 Tax=Aestuariispira ectoiniformans TaxID=2775080 RepID=UPI00223C0500|nr:hypothetical protein [Aestuariispira ectoiniformans]
MNSTQCEIPEPADFQAAFGCNGGVDSDLIQSYEFIDKSGKKLRLTFGEVDCSFGLSVYQDGKEATRVYDEFLYRVKICEEKQAVEVYLTGPTTQFWEIVVWPEICVSVTRMK